MNKTAALIGVMALAILPACSQDATPQKQSAAGAVTARDEQSTPTPATTTMKPGSDEGRAKMAAGMLSLIDTTPSCQPFRAQLEEASKVPDGPSQDMVDIVIKAKAAGCGAVIRQP